jgi:hypothetical protein
MGKRTNLLTIALAVTLSLVAFSSSVSRGEEEAPASSSFAFLPYCSKVRMDIYIGDYDEDGRSDLGIFRGKDNTFHVLLSDGDEFGAEDSGQWIGPNQFGNSNGQYYIGDYDGDDRSDLGFFNAANNSFHVNLSTGEGFGALGSGRWIDPNGFGNRNGRFYVGFFNGGKKSDLGFFAPSNNSFWVSLSTGTAFGAKYSGQWIAPGEFGNRNGRFYVGDINRDGSQDLGFFEPANSSFYVSLSNGEDFGKDGSGRWIPPGEFGNAKGEYYVGDYDGDGDADLGFFEPGDNSFYVARSAKRDGEWGFPESERERWIEPGAFGHGDGLFYVGDFNGGGKDDLGFYDPADGSFTVGLSTGYPGFDYTGSGVWANIR